MPVLRKLYTDHSCGSVACFTGCIERTARCGQSGTSVSCYSLSDLRNINVLVTAVHQKISLHLYLVIQQYYTYRYLV